MKPWVRPGGSSKLAVVLNPPSAGRKAIGGSGFGVIETGLPSRLPVTAPYCCSEAVSDQTSEGSEEGTVRVTTSVPAVLSVRSRNSPHWPVNRSLAGLPAAEAVLVVATAARLAAATAATARTPSFRLNFMFPHIFALSYCAPVKFPPSPEMTLSYFGRANMRHAWNWLALCSI